MVTWTIFKKNLIQYLDIVALQTLATVDLLALSVGHRLCINFYVTRANFLTTLCLHLDVTSSCYFLSTLFDVDVNYSYIYLVYYNCSLQCIKNI